MANPELLDTESAADRVLTAISGAMELFGIYLGERLGCYAAMADGGSLTSDQLAARCGIVPRYAQEWCEAQAAWGLLACDNPDADSGQRRFRLSAGMGEVMQDGDSLAFLAPSVRCTIAAGRVLPELLDVYRGERTLGWEDFGVDMRMGQALANRPVFRSLLVQDWLPRVPDLHSMLGSGTQRRVAEVGCGMGWASIALAVGYPELTVHGYDIDAPSIEAARHHAADEGVDDRVEFHVADISDHDGSAPYDVVMAFECLHDMSRPVEALRAMRSMTAAHGSVLVVDERTEDAFTPNASLVERLLYGYSLTVCLPDGMSSQPSAGTGTVMRADTLRRYATDAGFGQVEVIELDHDQFRMYRLTP
jgi:2-polyprenyl-3-methyl-5-hydroxy-6-metoxy-1,4-benzoquinol methylase